MAQLQTSQRPRRATAGSAGLDLCATARLILTPKMGVQAIESDFQGPLEEGTVGLLLGHSSSTLKGLIIHPGVIDSDYTGMVKIMVESPRGITAINPGDRIAQLVILPSKHLQFSASKKQRGSEGFGSTGVDCTFLSLELDQRPTLKIKINGKDILGLLDTGADRSIIASKDWPPKWPKQASSQSLRGLGYSETPEMSAVMLCWEDAEGHSGTVQPYVLDLPISLWGRDLLKDMNYKLSNEYSRVSQKLMKDMGHHPNYGIGKFLQGRNEPTEVVQRPPRQGLGFS